MVLTKPLSVVAEILQTKGLTLETKGNVVYVNNVLVTEKEIVFKDFLFAYCGVTEKELFRVNTETRNLILIGKVVGTKITYKNQKTNLSFIIEK